MAAAGPWRIKWVHDVMQSDTSGEGSDLAETPEVSQSDETGEGSNAKQPLRPPTGLLCAAKSLCAHVFRDNLISNSKYDHQTVRRRPSFDFSARQSTKLTKSDHTLVPVGLLRAAKSACTHVNRDNLISNGVYDHQTFRRRPSFEFSAASSPPSGPAAAQ
jgi:hypothetical protein